MKNLQPEVNPDLIRMRVMLLDFMRIKCEDVHPAALFVGLIELAVDIGLHLTSEEHCVETICKTVNLLVAEKRKNP